jgi:hypothetical protein
MHFCYNDFSLSVLCTSKDEGILAQQLLAIRGGQLTINKGGKPLPCLCPLFLRQGRQRGNNYKNSNDNNNNLISKSSTIWPRSTQESALC